MIDRIKTLVECVLVKLGLKEPKKNHGILFLEYRANKLIVNNVKFLLVIVSVIKRLKITVFSGKLFSFSSEILFLIILPSLFTA